MTKVFGLENVRLVGTGKACPSSQDSIKIVTAIDNKQEENAINSKLKRRISDLKRKSKCKQP